MKYVTPIIFVLIIFIIPISTLFYENTGKNDYTNANYVANPTEDVTFKENVQLYMDKEFQKSYENYFGEQIPLYGEFLAVNQYFQYYALQKEVIAGKGMYEGSMYQRSKAPDEYLLTDEFSQNINDFCGYIDSEVYVSIIPQKENYVSENNPYLNHDIWVEYEKQLEENLSQITNCEYADFEKEVLTGPEDYMPYDHHWSSKGAYKYYAHITEIMGYEPLPIEEYEQVTVSKHGGGSYSNSITKYSDITSSVIYLNSPTQYAKTCKYMDSGEEAIINDMSYDGNTDYYLNLYLGYGKQDINCTNPEAPNDMEVAVLADSFGRPMPNFLLDTFTQVDYYYAPNEGTTKEQVESIKNGNYDKVIVLTYDLAARAVPKMSELY